MINYKVDSFEYEQCPQCGKYISYLVDRYGQKSWNIEEDNLYCPNCGYIIRQKLYE